MNIYIYITSYIESTFEHISKVSASPTSSISQMAMLEWIRVRVGVRVREEN
jgi:hypothetical protein